MIETLPNQLIAVGANLPSTVGEPVETIAVALADMANRGILIRAVSRFFATPCFPAGAGPDFVNAVVVVRSELASGALLEVLHQIESRYGRERKERWAGRPLDLDLLADGDAVLPDAEVLNRWMTLPLDQQTQISPDQLILPHPRIQDRAFVLVPLADVAPDWRHPVLDQTVTQMLAVLPDQETRDVRPL